MPILVLDEFPTFTITRLSITLPIFSICRGMTLVNPNAKLRNYFDILTIERGDPREILAEVTTFLPFDYSYSLLKLTCLGEERWVERLRMMTNDSELDI